MSRMYESRKLAEDFAKIAVRIGLLYRVGQKTGPFLRVYIFAMVGARNACDMSKFS